MCVHDARARRGDWIRRANDRRILTRTSRRRVRVILANACASSANRGTVSDSRLREESMYPRRSTTSTAQFARESSSFVIFGHLQTGTTGTTGSTGTTGTTGSGGSTGRRRKNEKIFKIFEANLLKTTP